MGLIGSIAALWGLAEATLFFVVPDVALSFLALRSRRVALIACLCAFAGAVAGGALMYGWGAASPRTAEATLEHVPGVDRAMIERVRREVGENGAVSVVLGPLTATPYKIYAVVGGDLGVAPAAMLLASVASRLGRFVLVSLLVSALARGPLRGWSLRRQRYLVIGVWVAIYLALLLPR